MTWGERLLNAILWMLIGGLIVSMAWWTSMPAVTESQRMTFLDERIRLLESKVLAERESCRVDHELAERSTRMICEWFAALGLEEK